MRGIMLPSSWVRPPRILNLLRLQTWVFSYFPNVTEVTTAGDFDSLSTRNGGRVLVSLDQRDCWSPGLSTKMFLKSQQNWMTCVNSKFAMQYCLSNSVSTATIKKHILRSIVVWRWGALMNLVGECFFLQLRFLVCGGLCASFAATWPLFNHFIRLHVSHVIFWTFLQEELWEIWKEFQRCM